MEQLRELSQAFLGKEGISLSQKNDAAQWIHENGSRTGELWSQGEMTLYDHHRLDCREARLDMLLQAGRVAHLK